MNKVDDESYRFGAATLMRRCGYAKAEALVGLAGASLPTSAPSSSLGIFHSHQCHKLVLRTAI